MTHLITFTTSKFDVSKETPNPINPVAGEGILKWLREKLNDSGYDVTEPEPEDWGWYVHVQDSNASYLVGASADANQSGNSLEWTIQIHRQRSLGAKIMGRNKLAEGDPLSVLVERMVRDDVSMVGVEIDRRA